VSTAAVQNPPTGLKAPGPEGKFLIGSTLDFQKAPLQFCLDMAEKYGDICKFKVGLDTWHLVNNAEFIHDVTVKKANIFHKPRLAKRLWKPFLGDGVLSLDGSAWKRLSRMIKPGFHKKRIDAYGEIMVQHTLEMLETWKNGPREDICADMTAVTLRIVAKTLFDADVTGGDTDIVGSSMHTLQECMVEHINMPLPVPKWWPGATNKRKLKAIADIENIVQGIIDERRASKQDRGDLLSMMVFAQDEEGKGMNNTELRDQAMTLIFAGHETTAMALSWMAYLMGQHQDVVQKMRDEIQEAVGDGILSVSDLPKLPYLEMVVKESMRILPSVWAFMREPTEDVQMGDYVIPKGDQVLVSPYVIHHNPKYFDNPDEFRPERFTPENERKLPKGAYVPFAAGARVCLGKAFAMMEARLILGTMVQHVDFEVANDFELDFLAQLSLSQRGGLPMNVNFIREPSSKAG
jgi:cytochrome P450